MAGGRGGAGHQRPPPVPGDRALLASPAPSQQIAAPPPFSRFSLTSRSAHAQGLAMPARSVARVLAALAMASAVSWFGCGGGGSDLVGPEPGSLDVTIATSGPEPDPDGYTLSIDGAAPEAIAVN